LAVDGQETGNGPFFCPSKSINLETGLATLKWCGSWGQVIASVLLGLIFRKKLLELIPLLRKVKAGPLEAEFELATKQVLASTADLASKQQTPELKLEPN
jgi:hypothetical protein